MCNWISVEEKLPKRVWLGERGYKQKYVFYWAGEDIGCHQVPMTEHHVESGRITHWMPIMLPSAVVAGETAHCETMSPATMGAIFAAFTEGSARTAEMLYAKLEEMLHEKAPQ